MNSENTPENAVKKSKKKGEGLIGWLKIILFVFLFYTFAWEQNYVPTSSMEPTIETGDRIVSAKFAYGYNRYSVPFMNPGFLPEDKLFADGPNRGDIVTFYNAINGSTVVKRVIGLPGDQIYVRRSVLYINGKAVDRRFIRDMNFVSYDGRQIAAKEFAETLPNGVTYHIYEETNRGQYDNVGPYDVPAGHYFMMGDNRDRSADSRSPASLGYVDQKYLMGRADATTFSFYDCDRGKDIFCIANVPFGRFFRSLD